MPGRKAKCSADRHSRKLSRAETRQLRQERMQGNVPFRVLAKKFGVSVWTAHSLCT